jgi:hypothetical protein
MEIDGTLPMTAWSEMAVAGQSARKEHSPNTTETGSEDKAITQIPPDSKGLSPSKGTYSPASLKAAAARNALHPEVAENNLNAVNHISPIPRLILDDIRSRDTKLI